MVIVKEHNVKLQWLRSIAKAIFGEIGKPRSPRHSDPHGSNDRLPPAPARLAAVRAICAIEPAAMAVGNPASIY